MAYNTRKKKDLVHRPAVAVKREVVGGVSLYVGIDNQRVGVLIIN